MSRFIWFLLLLILPLISTKSQIASHWNTDSSYYFYQATDENLISEKISFKQDLTKKEILDSIAHYLTDVFFVTSNKYYKDKIKIAVNVQKLTTIEVSKRNLYIATINIVDPDKICMGTYFQGSTGGRITFLMLVSNLIQPQLEYPLLDGVIILYNSEELKQLDHINLEGLISEREIDNAVRRAITH